MNSESPSGSEPAASIASDPYRYVAPDPWGGVRAAGFSIRFVARFVDMIARTVVSGTAGMLFGLVFAAMHPERVHELSNPEQQSTASLYLTGLVASVVYHAVTESFGGASLGKLVCGLRVTTPTLGRATFRGAVVRNLAFFIDSLFFGLVAYSSMSKSDKQLRYGDRWGGTVVVHAEGAPDAARRTGGELALWVLVGLGFEAALVFVTMLLHHST